MRLRLPPLPVAAEALHAFVLRCASEQSQRGVPRMPKLAALHALRCGEPSDAGSAPRCRCKGSVGFNFCYDAATAHRSGSSGGAVN